MTWTTAALAWAVVEAAVDGAAAVLLELHAARRMAAAAMPTAARGSFHLVPTRDYCRRLAAVHDRDPGGERTARAAHRRPVARLG